MAVDAYLLDTSVASIAGYQGHSLHQKVRTWLDAIEDDMVFISAVSVAESEYGLNLNPLPAHVQQDIRRVMTAYKVLPIDHHTARIYGKIRADLFNAYGPQDNRGRVSSRYAKDLRESTSDKELGIQENDLWIVSVAIRYNLVFVTADTGGGMCNIINTANYTHRTYFLR